MTRIYIAPGIWIAVFPCTGRGISRATRRRIAAAGGHVNHIKTMVDCARRRETRKERVRRQQRESSARRSARASA